MSDHIDYDEAYAHALSDLCSGYRALEAPHLIPIADSAVQHLIMASPGTTAAPWNADETPYMVEPMNMLASRHHTALVFVGPARTGKTAGLLLGWLTHNAINDPGDMLFIQMTKDKARDFSKTDVDRAFRYSPDLQAMKGTRAIDDNTFDITFKHGMYLKIAWPTVTNVSGSTYRYVAITDIDRIENAENVDGEGPLFELAKKRTTTFMSRGMTLVESSPGYPIIDPMWVPTKRHEAPPVGGVMGIYNISDRRRWYWKCPHCGERFEAAPGLGLFNMPTDDELLETIRDIDIGAAAAKWGSRIIPPCCGAEIPFDMKYAMNQTGRWASGEQWFDENDELQGETPLVQTLGYWMGGVAAAFQTWHKMIENHLSGLLDYAQTGSEERLKATTNVDQGMPYMSRHLAEVAAHRVSPEDRADRTAERYVVPEWTRTLLAAVDVQGGSMARFVVQLHAVGPFGEQQLVDRFDITESNRDGPGSRKAPIDPAGYPEDWHLITEKVVQATWKTKIEGLEIRPHAVIVDTGGEGKGNGGEGVANNSYWWYRQMRALGLANRVYLYKGGSSPGAPLIRDSLVGRRSENDKGDIPLFVCNPNLLSDEVAAGLRRQTPGPNYYHFPAPRDPKTNPDGWLAKAFFDELTAEVRDEETGVWSKSRAHGRNESFDLCRMLVALMHIVGIYKVKNWDAVTDWLQPLEKNSDVVTAQARREMKRLIEKVIETPTVTSREAIMARRHRFKPRSQLIRSPYVT